MSGVLQCAYRLMSPIMLAGLQVLSVPALLCKPAQLAILVTQCLAASLYANFRICLLRIARLSADDRRIAVLKSAFGAKTGILQACWRAETISAQIHQSYKQKGQSPLRALSLVIVEAMPPDLQRVNVSATLFQSVAAHGRRKCVPARKPACRNLLKRCRAKITGVRGRKECRYPANGNPARD